MTISFERAFDAIISDEEFLHLLDNYAEAIGAKGYAAGWASSSEAVEDMFAIRNDWAPETIATYYADYAHRDPWTQALRPEDVDGQFRPMSERVSPYRWANSALYNDLLKPSGDDTFSALGMAVQIPGALGGLTFYRGRCQADFNDRHVVTMQRDAADLARIVALKAMLRRSSFEASNWRALVDGLSAEAFVVNRHLRLVDANASGDTMLERGLGLSVRRGKLHADNAASQRALEAAVAALSDGSAKDLTVVPVQLHTGLRRFHVLKASGDGIDGRIILFAEMHDTLGPDAERILRLAYRLSPTEARLMIRLASGDTVNQLAEERGVSIDTVRTQYKAASRKMGCSKLVEAIIEVRRIATIGTPG